MKCHDSMDADDLEGMFEALPEVRAATSELRHADGALDVPAVAELFGISLDELRRVCDSTDTGADRFLGSLERCAYLLVLNPDPENFRRWLTTANDDLGGTSPLGMIRSGRPEVVAHLVADVLINRGG